jgi:hypothetical protein
MFAVLLPSLGLNPGVVSAHARVKSSTPANGATVPAGLTEITIIFTEEDNGITNGTIAFTVSSCVTFKETGKSMCGRFANYWNAHGGLAQQGFPISNEMQEKSDTDGNTYTVQYFERAVFEYHPENTGKPSEVLLSLLGNFLYKQKYPSGATGQKPNTTAGSVLFKETGKRLGGRFLTYWNAHGGLAQQGLPISDEFQEKNDLDGKTYMVQYFERAVFEYHPEKAGTPYEVLLSQLGTFRYKQKYGGGN